MCGRFTLTSNLDDLQGRFGFLSEHTDHVPRYNIAPTQQVLAVTNDGQRRGEIMRWGLVPSWANDLKIGARMINAVAETASTKPAFRNAFKKRRCLVLANGFFEWQKDGKRKIPTYIYHRNGDPLAFAGLWETWKTPDGLVIQSCTILTTEANSFIQPVHNRMPVILSDETQALWLDPLTEDPKILEPLLIPAPTELLTYHQVSSTVNSVKNQGPECVLPLKMTPASESPSAERRLFP
ncbi:MAG: SOS response-associated peptidase [SAR202 cluster bacterium]|nr:SOS response-associated peptidase [SAR202 cluster bacterium]